MASVALAWSSAGQAYTVVSTVAPELTADPLRVVLWVRDNVSAEDEARTVADVRAGLGLWESVETSHLRFETATIRSATRPATEPHELLVIVAYLEDLTLGGASLPSQGRPGTWFGARADFPGEGFSLVAAHEIGHTLGLLHSTLSSRRFSVGIPVMHWALAGVERLTPDDVAAVSVAYPSPSQPLDEVSGTLAGRVVSASSGLPIDGLHLVAVDAATGAPLVGLLSASQGQAGRFELRGVPPGVVELHLLDGRSFAGTGLALSPARIQSDNFPTRVERAFSLRAGERIELGDVPIPIEGYTVDRIGLEDVARPDDLEPRGGRLPSGRLGEPYLAYARVRGGVRPLQLLASSLPVGLSAYLMSGRRLNADPHGEWHLVVHGVPIAPGAHLASLELIDDHGTEGALELELEVIDPCQGARAGDSDGDGLCDDGDASGVRGDAACGSGQTRDCDDNCAFLPNADQQDADGDGVGDACEEAGVPRHVGFEAAADGTAFPEQLSSIALGVDAYASLGLRLSPVISPPMGRISETVFLQRAGVPGLSGLSLNLAALACCPTVLELNFDPPATEVRFAFWTPSAPLRVRAFDARGSLLREAEVDPVPGRVSLDGQLRVSRVRAEVEGQVLRVDDVAWTPAGCGALLDEDRDSVCTGLDNCPRVANPEQADADADGVGDACDLPCSDGLDNDADTLVDFPADPGCADPRWIEDPRCADGVDNDGDGRVDWDGGPAGAEPDPDCQGSPWRDRETARARCGLGLELALALPLVAALRRAR